MLANVFAQPLCIFKLKRGVKRGIEMYVLTIVLMEWKSLECND